MASMISKGPGYGDGDGPGLGVEDGGAGKPDSDVVRIGVGKVGNSVGIVTMDVMVVTTGGPGNGYGVSRGAR
jgi:hypothetical protein